MEQEKKRLLFIDIFRGIAVIWMIETHVVNGFMNPIFRKNEFFGFLNLTNGIVAVSFLFCAGAGFYLAASAKWNDYKGFKKPLFLYLRRLGFILAIAYFLHLPVLSFKDFLNMPPDQALVFFQSDILHVIVLSSLFALLILFISSSLKYLSLFTGIVSALVFIAAPFVWAADSLQFMPTFIGAYFAKPPVSNFPLFPWMGYFFAGVSITGFFMMSEKKKQFAIISAVISIVSVLINYNTSYFQPQYGFADWWGCAPGHSLFRLGGAVAVFSVLYLLEKYFRENKPTKFLLICGRESLFMYASHLLIVYGSILSFGLRNHLSGKLGVPATILFFIGLTAFCFFFAWLWHILKKKNMFAARLIMAGLAGVFFVIFGSGIWGLK
jgi:uncharacterized membrane protein